MDDKPNPGWTRITTHLDGIAHEIQLVSGELHEWIEVLEDELSLGHLRGTVDGASQALTFVQQAAQQSLQGDIDSFGSAWGVGVTALWMYLCVSHGFFLISSHLSCNKLEMLMLSFAIASDLLLRLLDWPLPYSWETSFSIYL